MPSLIFVRSDQTVHDYVFEFDNAYTVAKSKAKLLEIPGAYPMYVLIKDAKILDHDRKIVLSAVDIICQMSHFYTPKLLMIGDLVKIPSL